jgi:hypothetical protein
MIFHKLVNISAKQAVRDMPKITKPSRSICKQFQHGKQSRVSFKTNEYATSKPFKLVHTYLCGKTRKKSYKEKTILFFSFMIIQEWIMFPFSKINIRYLKISKHSKV